MGVLVSHVAEMLLSVMVIMVTAELSGHGLLVKNVHALVKANMLMIKIRW